ncbi:hypothetical protein BTJ39_02480 [Izhakiella australiensis]|uniref:ABC transmembrane type-1 domain-containing protein n=1 Tax=Izhakiella australiensis TaxID=1926881 RepID=A0A1S8YT13_9GAMM|nr:hypothetical protein BTJ39_02480 [Izhakiella australiensis]
MDRHRSASTWLRYPWLVTPAALFYLIFFGVPLAQMVLQSFQSDGWTLESYITFFSEPAYWRMLGYTFFLGAVSMLIVLLVAYPVAWWLTTLSQRYVVGLMALVLIPFWSSGLVRTYAWIVILGREGIVNKMLMGWGWIDHPLPFLGTTWAVVIGLLYYLLPYMILSLYSVMNHIDRNLLLAARNLGASPASAFWHVFVPLTKPGIFSGCFLVFMLAIGMYITPALLGGPQQSTLPLMIALQINEALDWSLAASMSVILLLLVLVMQMLAGRYVNLDSMWGGSR